MTNATPIDCRQCSQPFTPTDRRQRLCSDACRADRERSRVRGAAPAPAECAECGETFTPSNANALVCSSSCRTRRDRESQRRHRAEHAPARVAIECVECGEPFTPANGNQRICSRGCRLERYNRTRRQPPAPRACPQCGELKTYPATRKYCGADCARAANLEQGRQSHKRLARERRRARPCEACGASFKPPGSGSWKYCEDCDGAECSVPDCVGLVNALGYCQPHYRELGWQRRPCIEPGCAGHVTALDRCAWHYNKHTGRSGKRWRGARREFVATRWPLFGGTCYLCGEPLALEDLVTDHVYPRKHYPQWRTVAGNLAPTHGACNRAKSSREPTPAELVAGMVALPLEAAT